MKRFFAIVLGLFTLLSWGCQAALETELPLADRREVPILMYHSILKDPAKAGAYILSPEVLEQDLTWLLDRGYETVTGQDLVAYVSGTGTLPEKPVMITFDDGHLNNLTYVLPLLYEYDCCGVVSVVGAYTQRFSDQPDPNSVLPAPGYFLPVRL